MRDVYRKNEINKNICIYNSSVNRNFSTEVEPIVLYDYMQKLISIYFLLFEIIFFKAWVGLKFC